MKYFVCLVVGMIASYSSTGFCWGALGHQIIGAVADERMEPATRAYLAGVLGIESAALAAVWADAVRDDERFGHNEHELDQDKKDADDNNFSDYHFVDVPAGFNYDTRPNKDLKDAYGALRGAIEVLKDGQSKRPEKIIALRYVIHLVGDIHQPLHVGNNHDIGGNFCSVFWQTETAPINLHAAWDGPMITELGKSLKGMGKTEPAPAFYPAYLAALKKMRADELYAAKPKDVSLSAIKSWINESADIRDNKAGREIGVYPEKSGQLSQYPNTEYMHRPYCMWLSDTRSNTFGDTSPKHKGDIPLSVIPRLDNAYVLGNVKVVEQQVITAGIRLAAVLDDIARSQQGPGLSDEEQQLALTSLQNLFHNPRQ
jgi:hypothetical protein